MKFTTFCRRHKIKKAQLEELIAMGMPTMGADELDEDDAVEWIDEASVPDTILTTKAAVERHFKVSNATVYNWARHDDFPKLPAPAAEFEAFRKRMLQRSGRLKVVNADGTEGGSYANPTDRYRIAKSELAELELEQRRGNLVNVEYMTNILRRCCARKHQIRNAVPHRIGFTLEEMKIEQDVIDIVVETVEESLKEMARMESQAISQVAGEVDETDEDIVED